MTNKRIHNRLYSKMLQGTRSHFEETDRSELISRFSNDMSVLDMSMPTVLCDAVESPLYFLNLVIVISIKVYQWAFTVPFLFLAIFLIYKHWSTVLQKSKALDLKTKASLITNFSTLVKGATQIGCSNLEETLFAKLNASLIGYFRANHLNNLLQRGFGFFIQSGTLVFSILGVAFTYYYSWDLMSGQELIYSIALSDYIQLGIRQIATLDSLMMSAQRLFSLDSIPSEELEDETVVDPPESWAE
jgi:ABC-type transport system involved in cytochrome bd biosynthesis fused ATPase/permease subunit